MKTIKDIPWIYFNYHSKRNKNLSKSSGNTSLRVREQSEIKIKSSEN